jgi:hypothetical protein
MRLGLPVTRSILPALSAVVVSVVALAGLVLVIVSGSSK